MRAKQKTNKLHEPTCLCNHDYKAVCTCKPAREDLRVGHSKRLWHVIRFMKSGRVLRGFLLNKYENKDAALSYARAISEDEHVERVWMLLIETKVIEQETVK